MTGELRGEAMTLAQAFRQEGMQQGMQQEKYAIAKNLMAKGLSKNLIADATGLSVDEIRLFEEEV